MTLDDRVNTVRQLGFTERQARFLTMVALHASVCVPRQFATFAGVAYGHKVNRFFDRLVARRYAVACDCRHNRASLYHVRSHALYRAVGEPHSRYRRPVSTAQAIRRVMRLDAMLTGGPVTWLSTFDEKLQSIGIPTQDVGRERPATSRTHTRFRWLSDALPIGVESDGRLVLALVCDEASESNIRACIRRHRSLLRAAAQWTLRLTWPRELASRMVFVEAWVRDELTVRLAPSTMAEMRWYFEELRATADPRRRRRTDERFARASRAFSRPRWVELYREWMTSGAAAVDTVLDPAISDALTRGTGRIETQVLPFSYRHLSPLVALADPASEGVEEAAESAPPSQPPPTSHALAPPKSDVDWWGLVGVPRTPPAANNLRDAERFSGEQRHVPPER